jgi:Transposase domain (DUF772)
MLIPPWPSSREIGMRGSAERTGSLFSFVELKDQVPKRHPPRKIREIVIDAMAALDGQFAGPTRPRAANRSRLRSFLRASLLQPLYSVRSERQLMKQLDYNPLLSWFVVLGRRPGVRPRLDQRAINREVVFGQQRLYSRWASTAAMNFADERSSHDRSTRILRKVCWPK